MSLETTFPGEPTVMTSASVWGEQACGLIQEGKHATRMRTSIHPAYPTRTLLTDPTGDSCLQGLGTTFPLLGGPPTKPMYCLLVAALGKYHLPEFLLQQVLLRDN